MARQALTIEKFYGGLSEGDRSGLEGSFYYGKGLDYKTNIDTVTSNLALGKSSGTTVDSLVKWLVYDPVQNDLYGYAANGKIFQFDNLTTWSSLRTVASSSGQGMELYDDYLYYTQASQVGRYGALSGAPGFTDNWQTSLNGTTSWRPIKTFMNLLLVGNGRYLATWDGSTWTAQKLTFPPGHFVQDIDVRGEFAAIAVNDNADVTKATRGYIFYWDGTSSTYNFFTEIVEGGGISSIQANQESVWAFPGNAGNIYLDTGRVTKIKRIPFVGEGKTVYVYPGADCNFRGLLTFGLAGGTDTNVYRGVYELGQPNLNYPLALNFSYPISTATVQGAALHIGAIIPIGPQIYVSWQDSTTYGIDVLSTTSLQTSTTLETRIAGFESEVTFDKFKFFFDPLASGETLTFKYKTDKISSWTTIGTASYTSDGVIAYKMFSMVNNEVKCHDIQFQITLAGSVSNAPAMRKIIGEFTEGLEMGIVAEKNVSSIPVDLISTSTGLTTANYYSNLISFAKTRSYVRYKLFFETLVSGDSITLYYDADRTGSWTTLETATFATDGAVTFKLLNEEFRANDVQFKITATGTSAPPVINRLVVEAKTEGYL